MNAFLSVSWGGEKPWIFSHILVTLLKSDVQLFQLPGPQFLKF